MNVTTYIPNRTAAPTIYFRRSSLENFKNNQKMPIPEQKQTFRKSCSSFDMSRKKSRQQLPQIKYQKQMENNIYFNQKSRAQYFKGLIDCYFQKNQDKSTTIKNHQNPQRKSYLLRKSLMNNRSPEVQQLLSKNIKNSIKNNDNTSQNYNKFTEEQKRLQGLRQIKKPSFSLRYKQKFDNLNQKKPSQTQGYLKQMSKFTETSLKAEQQSPKSNYSPTQFHFVQPSFLPKITEAGDDGEEDFIVYSSQSISLNEDNQYFMKSQSSFKRLVDQKILIYENHILTIYSIKENNQKYRIKQFKNLIFLNRHKKAVQYEGVTNFWKPYRFDQMSLMIPYIFPLKDLLYKIVPHPTNPQLYYINPKTLYYRLVANNCQQMFLLFRQLIKDVKKFSNKVINNKINLSNIFYLNGKFCIGDWEYSAFKDQNKIQGNYFQSRIQPILKCQKQWLISPQYLSPEILQSVDNPIKQFDIWQYQNSSDIYSLGITFLQMVTLIPVWMQNKSTVNGKIMKPRSGSLSTQNRSINRILQKQRTLPSRMYKTLQRQVNQNEKNWKFFNVLLRMIQPNAAKRIRAQQILNQTQ